MSNNRGEQEKECPRCGEMKSIREFFVFKKGVKTKGGGTVRKRYEHCRYCRKILYDRHWRSVNKLRIRKYKKEYRRKVREHNKRVNEK